MNRLALAGTAWLLVSVSGMAALEHYKAIPGSSADAPEYWPPESGITRDAGLPTLVFFAHPRCPCSRASLTELRKLAERLAGSVSLRVLFIRPAGSSKAWEETDLWAKARAIPGAEVVLDTGAAESALFGSQTSGQVLLYTAGGHLWFQGGITAARGHEGDNPGAARIVSLVREGAAPANDAPVFGCPLFASEPKERS